LVLLTIFQIMKNKKKNGRPTNAIMQVRVSKSGFCYIAQ
jgi:hypothetical protein